MPLYAQFNPYRGPRPQFPPQPYRYNRPQPGQFYRPQLPVRQFANQPARQPAAQPYGQPGTQPPSQRSPQPVNARRNSTPAQPVNDAKKANVATKQPYSLYPRIVAEYEPQRAIALSVSDLQPQHEDVLKQVVEKSAGHAEILILYNNDVQLKQAVDALADLPVDHVSFLELKLDTVWLRDFGPRIAEVEKGTRTIDFFYHGVRPYDDSFPERWGLHTNGKLTKVPWTLQGGNLICNGMGLGITTSRIFEDNKVSIGSSSQTPTITNDGKQFVLDELQKSLNLQAMVILEPLRNESTKHVDMFAAFLASDLALVADLGPSRNINARVLDYNAKKLAEVKMDGKPLRVERIRIPEPDGTAWSTYTNAIFTDRMVLVPTMKTDPPRLITEAVATYRRLLPDHHIETIDITSMKKLQGSLHCLSVNIPEIAPMPDGVFGFESASRIAKTVEKPKKKNNTSQQAQDASKRYPIDEQLRRIFKSSTHDYLVDAYAVAVQGDAVTLLQADNHKLIRVKRTGVCKTDQYWISRNANKIRKSGASVHKLITARQPQVR